MEEKYNILYADLAEYIEAYPDKGNMNIQFNELERDIRLVRDGIVLHIYIKDNLVGYEIYPEAACGMRLLSDTDLYDLANNEGMYESMLKEIEYILNEYLAGRVIMKKVVRRWILGRSKDAYSITLNTPDGEAISLKLPCINLIDFGF